MGTVNLPVVGKTPKGVVVVAVLAGTGALAYSLYRHNKKQQTTAASTASGAGVAGNAAATAYGYGGYGGYGAYAYGYGFGSSGLGEYPGGNYYGYGYYGAGTQYPVPQQATTNAQWSQAAVSALTGQGYNGAQVLAALGLYLTGGQLNTDQVGVVQAAIAAEGYPPVDGAGGYPPAWHTSGNGGHPGTSDVPVPNVVGETQEDAFRELEAAGLHGKGHATVKGKTLTVTAQNPKAGTKVKKGFTVTLTSKVEK